MGDLSKDFSLSEFTCPCGCGTGSLDPCLVTALQHLRDSIQRPIRVISGMRCARHNKDVGGVVNSWHLRGGAADIRANGMTSRELYAAALREPLLRGLGVDDERGSLHVDVRAIPARWCYHNGKQTTWHEVTA